MKYLYTNKNAPVNQIYNLDKLLYLMIDRPNKILYNTHYFIWQNDKNQWHRDYNFPAVTKNI